MKYTKYKPVYVWFNEVEMDIIKITRDKAGNDVIDRRKITPEEMQSECLEIVVTFEEVERN